MRRRQQEAVLHVGLVLHAARLHVDGLEDGAELEAERQVHEVQISLASE